MSTPEPDTALPPLLRLTLAASLTAFGVLLGWALWQQSGVQASLTEAVMAELPRSGVTNPVTAVLLNFRAFDTMLELAVLLLVAVTVGTLRDFRATSRAGSEGEELCLPVSPLLLSLARDLTPVMLLISAYLLWVGAKEPGGAFQAGAVLASAAVLGYFAKRPWRSDQQDAGIRGVLVLGTGAFLVSALAMLTTTGVYFGYPVEWASLWILAIEIAATLSIAATLYVSFCAVMPAQGAS